MVTCLGVVGFVLAYESVVYGGDKSTRVLDPSTPFSQLSLGQSCESILYEFYSDIDIRRSK